MRSLERIVTLLPSMFVRLSVCHTDYIKSLSLNVRVLVISFFAMLSRPKVVVMITWRRVLWHIAMILLNNCSSASASKSVIFDKSSWQERIQSFTISCWTEAFPRWRTIQELRKYGWSENVLHWRWRQTMVSQNAQCIQQPWTRF